MKAPQTLYCSARTDKHFLGFSTVCHMSSISSDIHIQDSSWCDNRKHSLPQIYFCEGENSQDESSSQLLHGLRNTGWQQSTSFLSELLSLRDRYRCKNTVFYHPINQKSMFELLINTPKSAFISKCCYVLKLKTHFLSVPCFGDWCLFPRNAIWCAAQDTLTLC